MVKNPLTAAQRQALAQSAWGDANLTLKQRNFVEALVGPAGGNATKAARMAGYASSNGTAGMTVIAYNTLRKPAVQEAIAHALARRKLTAEWAKEALADSAQSSMANFLSVDDNGKPYLDFTKAAAPGAIGQIKEYTEDEVLDKDGNIKCIRRKLKLQDPMPARGLLLRFHGLIKDNATTDPLADFTQAPAALASASPPPGTIPVIPQQSPVQDSTGSTSKRKK